MRAMGVVGGWAAGVAAATAVSWAGVSLVGAEVSPSGPAALSQAEVQHRIQDAGRTSGAASATARPSGGSARPSGRNGAGPGATATGLPGGPGPGAPSSQQSVVTQGGTAVLTCTGDTVS